MRHYEPKASEHTEQPYSDIEESFCKNCASASQEPAERTGSAAYLFISLSPFADFVLCRKKTHVLNGLLRLKNCGTRL